jgi:hypothetical protein
LLVNESTTQVLANELQLGTQLNECIHDNRRSQFSLMLAMLTDDVREHAQFLLPKTEEIENTTDEDSLRKLFHVASPTPLALETLEQVNDYNQAELIADNKLSELRLKSVLRPNPIAFRDDVKYIDSDIINNTSVHCQKRQLSNNEQNKKSSRLNFKAKEWLDVVNQSLLNVQLTA